MAVVTSTLTVFLQESLGAIKPNFPKPNFPGTELGKKCSELWDDIQHRKALPRDRQIGLLTLKVRYDEDCFPTFGGRPGLATETGVGGANNNSADGGANNSDVLEALSNPLGSSGNNFPSTNFSTLLNLTSNTTTNK